MTHSRTFSCQPQSVTAARRFVREVLSEQPQETAEAAELMACELATNCVLHAHSGFEITVTTQAEIRIEVSDTGEGRPVLRSPKRADSSGRGLRIVQGMAEDWGVIPAAVGKTVWFTLPAAPADPRHGQAPARERRTASA